MPCRLSHPIPTMQSTIKRKVSFFLISAMQYPFHKIKRTSYGPFQGPSYVGQNSAFMVRTFQKFPPYCPKLPQLSHVTSLQNTSPCLIHSNNQKPPFVPLLSSLPRYPIVSFRTVPAWTVLTVTPITTRHPVQKFSQPTFLPSCRQSSLLPIAYIN